MDNQSSLANNEEFHREALRKSKDIFMVYNPTDKDFLIDIPGSQGFDVVIPNKNKNVGFGNGKKEVERWVMDVYKNRMTVNLINIMGDEKGRAELAQLAKNNIRFKDKYEENTAVWNNQRIVPRTDDAALKEQFAQLIVLGLVREFGDELPDQDYLAHQSKLEPVDKKIEKIINRKYVPDQEDMDNLPTLDEGEEVDVPTLNPEPTVEPLKAETKPLKK